MGYRHSRDDILAGALDVARTDGLSALSFGSVARRLGINDRTVVYYFASKETLVSEVLTAFAFGLQSLLETAFGSEPCTPAELAARAWPALTTDEADGVFSVFFEATGLAAARIAPYDRVVPTLVDLWVQWLAPRVSARTERQRHDGALALLAQIDGLLLLRRMMGADAADRAARTQGIDVRPGR